MCSVRAGKFEFDYASLHKGVERMIPVVMERECADPKTWQGAVCGKLGSKLYVNLVDDSVAAFQQGIDHLAREICGVTGAGLLLDSNEAFPDHLVEAQVVHDKRGMGTIIEIKKDGTRVVQFASGETHCYKAHSMGKLQVISPGLVSSTEADSSGKAKDREDGSGAAGKRARVVPALPANAPKRLEPLNHETAVVAP